MRIELKKPLDIFVGSLLAMCSFNAQANLLVNSGFESGLTSWQTVDGVIRNSDPTAYEGVNYIFGGFSNSYQVFQDIDLLGLGFSAATIDAGDLTVEYGGWQSGWNSNDLGQITIRFYDASSIEIASSSLATFTSNKLWVEQTGSTALLSGTRVIRFEFSGIKNSGSNNDSYLDNTNVDIVSESSEIDSDGDGLSDSIEDSNGNGMVDAGETDPFNFDSDVDGLSDGYEVNVIASDPLTSTTVYLTPGDMNVDGTVDVGDLILLRKQLLSQ